MCGMVRIGRKLLDVQEATEKLNSIGLGADDFSKAMHIFNYIFPFEGAIVSTDGWEGSIRGSSKEITETEAV